MTTTSCKPRLFCDIETFSSVDLTKSGVYPYAESPDFEVLLIAYAVDEEPVRALTVSDVDEWIEVKQRLTDPNYIKVAHNSAFERACLSKWLGIELNAEDWEDTMIMAAYNGLPLSLEGAGAALGITDQKMKEGTALINYFSKPCKPTIANGQRTRNWPAHAPEKWQTFIDYCVRDVEAMRQIYRKLESYPVMKFERRVWTVDASINERGVKVDLELAEAAIAVDKEFKAEHVDEMKRLTGLENPNSVSQLKKWLSACGVEAEALNKATVAELRESVISPTVRRVLELRQLLSKTSTKKYQAVQNAVCSDGRVRGLLQYYGAARTGRWAGRLLQLQNLPQNHLDHIDLVREVVRSKDLQTLELLYDSVPDTLSQLIRTVLVAKEGCTFLVADYSAIEARVIAYLAGEQWQMDAFAAGKDLYCETASQMFGVPVEKHGVNSHLRQKGKIATLACGYGGGVNALKAFGADKMGLTEEEMQDIVTQWRIASPTIPRLWRDTENAAKQALLHPGKSYKIPCGVIYYKDRDALRCKLPSGRLLTYWQAELDSDGKICFMGQNQTTRKWEKTGTWGGKLVENIVQAYARDCLAVALVRLDEAGYKVVFSVHDEIIAEAPEGSKWEDMAEIMSSPIPWAPGLKLDADGYETPFYIKA